jgi:hypothetical protein
MIDKAFKLLVASVVLAIVSGFFNPGEYASRCTTTTVANLTYLSNTLAIRVANEISSAAKKFSIIDPLHAGGFIQRAASQRLLTAQQASVMDDLDTDHAPTNTKKRALVDDFVKKMGGKRTLQRILIANNGMAATKAILSMRQWAYMVLGKASIRINMEIYTTTSTLARSVCSIVSPDTDGAGCFT